MIAATVLDLDGKPHRYTDLDRVSFVNNESYGPGERVGGIEKNDSGKSVLIVNVNGITAARFDT